MEDFLDEVSLLDSDGQSLDSVILLVPVIKQSSSRESESANGLILAKRGDDLAILRML